ncbi:MAG: Smr/MutS family protein [Treponema sp.]|nr:Smr/MutS family protein [Candidatus Treponema caballi]
MDTNTLENLDYFRVRDTIAGFCMSEEGTALLKTRLPYTEKKDIQDSKEESREFRRYLDVIGGQPITGWAPCGHLFKKLGIEGYALEVEDAYALGMFCKSTAQAKDVLTPREDSKLKLPHLAQLADELPLLNQPENAIFRIIDTGSQIRDLPELKAIRKSILHLRNDIDSLIRSYTSDNSMRDMLQSDVPALRSDRQVLAVKANYRGRIKGIVHEVSQSGQTVFIEPDEVVQKNNELVQEEFRLSQEVRRILRELTAELGQFRTDFEKAHALMLRLDCAYASARWGREINGTYAFDLPADPDSLENGTDTTQAENAFRGASQFASPVLIKARHPLLGTRAVPIDVQFQRTANDGRGHRILIITGPNTGGKTVTLKTVALLSMLNQSGFPIPAAEGTSLPFFKSVYADIGDEQSLDESLSTFGGHMKNIARILREADGDSLVLLDELGSGTDPQEGGAIAMATLDELIRRDSFVLVTTHHGILKNYGYTHPSCINASVEFDADTLSPTYRILMGVPGESHALDIAERNGLPEDAVKAARSYISNNQADISALIDGLNKKHEELARLEAEAKQKERHISEKWRKVDLKDLKLRQHEMELREQGWRKSRDFLDENRKMLENLVRELREGEITREKTLKVKEVIKNLTDAVEAEKASMDQDLDALATDRKAYERAEAAARSADKAGKAGKAGRASGRAGSLSGAGLAGADSRSGASGTDSGAQPTELSEGVDVLVGKNEMRGTIVGPAKKGSWFVQVGSMKLTCKESELVIAKQQSRPTVSVEVASDSDDFRAGSTSRGGVETSADGRVTFGTRAADRPQFELRLLGMRYEEAEKALQRQLDLCVIHNFKEFSVIHGKGNGILQQMVHNHLKELDAVKEFHFAKPEDGGSGKTYVTLK